MPSTTSRAAQQHQRREQDAAKNGAMNPTTSRRTKAMMGNTQRNPVSPDANNNSTDRSKGRLPFGRSSKQPCCRQTQKVRTTTRKKRSLFTHTSRFLGLRDFKQAVTISTCHAAKGLEWPVVFIPAGSFTLLCDAMCH